MQYYTLILGWLNTSNNYATSFDSIEIVIFDFYFLKSLVKSGSLKKKKKKEKKVVVWILERCFKVYTAKQRECNYKTTVVYF